MQGIEMIRPDGQDGRIELPCFGKLPLLMQLESVRVRLRYVDWLDVGQERRRHSGKDPHQQVK